MAVSFRVHFADGEHLDINAEDAKSVRKTAEAMRPGHLIQKIKQLKEAGSHAC